MSNNRDVDIKVLEALEEEELDILMEIWESSVRATHDFLQENDIDSLRPMVRDLLPKAETLVAACDGQGCFIGFMGVRGREIEMLFIDPGARGKGVGKALIRYAMRTFDVDTVEVNEQNEQAVGFYQHMGFQQRERFALDGQGNPFPILKMCL